MKTTAPAQAANGTGRWEVRIARNPDLGSECTKVLTLAEAAEAGRTRFVVKSPRGQETFSSTRQGDAMSVALSMASIDELLARVNRIEHGLWGNHPALRAQMTNKRNGAKTASRGTLTLLQDPHA
ncbi:Uncharacterised protein [Mycobacteroides abscessus]|uniref:hypothetical protein n=1 Tax=Mycobacteroides abscessus TaxID=36809 RepID=UPI0005E67B3D|nr:hypothetical protein [Mycobacteroides abscessus]PVB12980.1 hypothetical protein DDJ68_22195 [Mycobacteroides abscessus]RIR99526.1 hypothetical protein D2E57_02495 [Mycobacteroides abscessus]CPR89972.1 Uncharacterised protein [Mycobacteroides abscessus]CPU82560.1 Uncharacterised protein [Mycobacteroides abscessus]CPW68593.1 Uncharacterised protein [Mycobacteroides abscessus]